MAITLLDKNSGVAPGSTTGTSGAIDSTGATLLVIIILDGNSGAVGTLTDSKSNTWHALTQYGNAAGSGEAVIYYSYDKAGSPLSVGSGHTCSTSGAFPFFVFTAFNGTVTSPTNPLETSTGNVVSASTTIQPGSLTGAESGALYILGVGGYTSNFVSVDSGFTTLINANLVGGTNFSGFSFYLVQGSASALNPTTTVNLANGLGAAFAVFKPANTGFTKSVSDTISIVETLKWGITKKVTETISLVETFKCATTLKWAETINLVETIRRAISIKYSEVFSITEVFSKGFVKVFNEVISLAEIFRRGITIKFSEVISLVETIFLNYSHVLIFHEVLSLIDQLRTFVDDLHLNYFRNYLGDIPPSVEAGSAVEASKIYDGLEYMKDYLI